MTTNCIKMILRYSSDNIVENGDDITSEYVKNQDMLEGDGEDDESRIFAGRGKHFIIHVA